MTDFLVYDLKVAVLIAVFYMFYRLLLSRETFHRVNRIMLLLTAMASFLLPLCVITMHKTVVAAMPEVSVGDLQMEALLDTETDKPLWQDILPVLYIIGVVMTMGHTLLSILKVILLIRRCERHPQADGTTICVSANEKVAPFSWMRYIVMNESDYEALDAAILAHERGHIRLHHSWDLLLVDTLTALQWFNPAMWMLRSDLRAIHEYEADGAVLSQGINARQYQYLLITKAGGIGGYSIANGINHSALKNRITMMTNKTSKNSHLLKLLALIPIVGITLALNARTVTDYVYDEPQKKQIIKKGKANAKINAGTVNEIVVVEQASKDESATESNESFTARGMVCDEVGKPIVGAIVQVDGTKRGTVTDREGRFQIEVSHGETLKFAYVGYESILLHWGKPMSFENIKISLLPEGSTPKQTNAIFDVVEQMPQFPGGPAALMEYLSKNVRYPEEAHKSGIQGRVLCSFVVEKDGSISDASVVKSVDPLLDEEALRVVNSMPNWTPGTQNGEPVRVKYTIPLTFKLDNSSKEAVADNIPKDVDVEVDGKLVEPEVLKLLQGGEIDRITVEKAKSNGERSKIIITTKKVK